MYLVHSFYPNCAESIATTNYEVEYASAVQKIIFMEPSFTLKSGDVKVKNSWKLLKL
jgi:glutamine amidotransferase